MGTNVESGDVKPGQIRLGQLLRDERTRRQQRQIETAEVLGVSQSGYARWETGENRPADDKFADVADYLRLPLEEVWSIVHGRAYPTAEDLETRLGVVEGELADVRRMLGEILELVQNDDRSAATVSQKS